MSHLGQVALKRCKLSLLSRLIIQNPDKHSFKVSEPWGSKIHKSVPSFTGNKFDALSWAAILMVYILMMYNTALLILCLFCHPKNIRQTRAWLTRSAASELLSSFVMQYIFTTPVSYFDGFLRCGTLLILDTVF